MGLYIPFDESELQEDSNNFFCHFPIGNDPYPTERPEGLYRNIGQGEKFRGRTYRAFVTEFSGLAGPELEDYFVGRSDKRCNQTPEEFYADIDQTVAELGMDMELVKRTINTYVHDRSLGDSKNGCELFEVISTFLVPIYVALRKKGYNREDLVA